LRNRAIIEYLAKWKNLLMEEVAWEDEVFKQKHPWLVKCQGKHLFEGEGHVNP
jgi:hypothetical protein